MSVYMFVIISVLIRIAVVSCEEQECNLSRRTSSDVIDKTERCSTLSVPSVLKFSCPIIVQPGFPI